MLALELSLTLLPVKAVALERLKLLVIRQLEL
jgi:hypothetical protein